MKAVASAGLLLAVSIVLQGCDDPWSVETEQPKAAAVEEKEASATCKDGKFSCSGMKQWCAEQMSKCGSEAQSGTCNPVCTWKCNTPKCDQVCAPKCDPPVCTTRCKGFNTDSCKMVCGQPNCFVACPKFMCPNQNCAKCKTKCGEPVCNMACGDDEQPCRHVCAEPRCNWQCSKPTDCPQPKCKMVCDKPKSCMGSNTQLVGQMPPLEPGESEVTQMLQTAASGGPAALVHMDAAIVHGGARLSSMRVNITTMESNHALQKRQVDIALGIVQVGSTWTRKIRERSEHGRTSTSEAACKDGHFQCQGDDAWCADQQKTMCDGDHHAFLQQRSRSQGHLQA